MKLVVVLGVFQLAASTTVDITPNNFKAITEGGIPTFVRYYRPTCPWSNEMNAAWNQLDEAYAGDSNVNIAAADCSIISMCGWTSCIMVPTMKYYSGQPGFIAEEYGSNVVHASRSFDALNLWVKSKLSKPSSFYCPDDNVSSPTWCKRSKDYCHEDWVIRSMCKHTCGVECPKLKQYTCDECYVNYPPTTTSEHSGTHSLLLVLLVACVSGASATLLGLWWHQRRTNCNDEYIKIDA